MSDMFSRRNDSPGVVLATIMTVFYVTFMVVVPLFVQPLMIILFAPFLWFILSALWGGRK